MKKFPFSQLLFAFVLVGVANLSAEEPVMNYEGSEVALADVASASGGSVAGVTPAKAEGAAPKKADDKPLEKAAEGGAKDGKPKDTDKFRIGGEAIYWEAVQGQLAIGNKITLDESGEVLTNKIIRPRFGAEWGYKVNMGYDFAGEEKWDMNATYVYLPMKGNTELYTCDNPDNEPSNINQVILLKTLNYDILGTTTKITGGQALSANFSTMQGFWTGHNEGIDFNFGRKIALLNGSLTLRPYAGIRARWGRQDYRFGGVINPQGTAAGTPSTGITTMNVHITEEFHNVSSPIGFWITYKIYKELSIVTQIGLSFGYTSWLVHQKLELFNTLPSNNYDDIGLEKDKFPSVGFGTDYYFGLQYIYKLCGMDIRARIGWEHHTSQQNVINSIGANLGTQGISAGLQASF